MEDIGLVIAMFIVMIYFFISQFIAASFLYIIAQNHSFLYTFFIGPFEAEFKGLLWPFFI